VMVAESPLHVGQSDGALVVVLGELPFVIGGVGEKECLGGGYVRGIVRDDSMNACMRRLRERWVGSTVDIHGGSPFCADGDEPFRCLGDDDDDDEAGAVAAVVAGTVEEDAAEEEGR